MDFEIPHISARMNAKGECVWASNSFCPLLSETHLCPVERRFSLRERMLRQDSAAQLQAAWRGYKVRKTLIERQAAEIAAVLPLWESLDEVYRLCVLCQNLAVILHHDQDTWDAEGSPWYIWMLTQGRHLESLETYMFQRGWVRPPMQGLDKSKAASATDEVMRLYKRGRYAPRLSLPRPPSWSYLQCV